ARNSNGTPNGFWDGLIDDFRIMDRVITATERAGIYNGGSGTEDQSGG
ncbi:unnamed protein product, partial [marine sediment metagenome]